MTFIMAPEEILFFFLKAFFSQAQLYQGIVNPFRYTDGKEIHTLAIQWSDDFDGETPNAVPALVISEGGFAENKRAFGPGRKTWETNSGNELYKTNLYHSFIIHCIGQTKGESKWLQAVTGKALMTFRWAIYEMGINDISGISGSPPQKIKGAQNSPEMYDSVLQFQMAMDDHWVIDRTGYEEDLMLVAFKAMIEPLPVNDLSNVINANIQIEE